MMRGRRRRRRAGKILLRIFFFLLIIGIGAAAAAAVIVNTEGRSGGITGSALAQWKEIQKITVRAAKKRQEPPEFEFSDAPPEVLEEAVEPAHVPRLRIVLDAGHGGPGIKDEQELGAIYRDTYEKYLTLEIAKAMAEELSGYGNVEVFLTRTSDQAMTLKERAAYGQSVNADLLVSLHLNASLEHNFYGSEVFVSAFDRFHARGRGVGESILNQLTDYGFVSKGVKTRLGSRGDDYYGIIRECKTLGIPALIVEHGYMDEDSDWAKMNTSEALETLGRRDAAGLAAYFGLQKGRDLTELPALNETLPAGPVYPDTTPPEEVWYRTESQGNGQSEITLHGTERESRVMYYDYSLDGGETYSGLKLWEGGDTIEFSMPLNGDEQMVFRVYNNYELRTSTAE